tara:strand:+ start:132 stop:479 length:348 start_codon:yes stop_codon:yes gene_type:complete
VKTIVQKVVKLETKRHDFDNDFAYVEVWRNNTLKDCYFAEKQYLWPDGSLKKDGTKYFYSPLHGDEIEKEIEPLNYLNFKWFNRLFYLDGKGSICQINSDFNNRGQADSLEEGDG